MTKESRISVFVNENAIKTALEQSATQAQLLTGLLAKLKALGAEGITIDELRKLVKSDGHPAVIKEIMLDGKDLKVGGLPIDPSFLQLPEKQIQELSRDAKRIDTGLDWTHFEVVEGVVVCLECGEKAIRERNTLYAGKKTKEAIDDAQEIADLVNRLYKKTGVNTYHPLRSIDRWFHFDGTKYVPHVFNIEASVK